MTAKAGYDFRIRMTYTGDTANASATTGWVYLRFG
jgi:hypothetical protein